MIFSNKLLKNDRYFTELERFYETNKFTEQSFIEKTNEKSGK